MMVAPLINEAKVLRARPEDEDDDVWPIFSLRDAEVFAVAGRKRKFEDLWRADISHGLVIEGTLDKLPRRLLKHSLTGKDFTPQRVRIPLCTHWSYGQHEDGEVTFWAAGRSGWFEIRPSRKYSPSYKALREAIECLYSCSDFYRANCKTRGAKAGQLNVPLQDLFADFARVSRYRCSDEEGARIRFYTHRHVLLLLMDKGLESVGWKWPKTEIYAFLSQQDESSDVDGAALERRRGESSPVSTSSSATSTPAGTRRPAGKSKSVLRPKSAQRASLKSRLRSDAQVTDDDDEPEADSPSAKRRKFARAIRDDASDHAASTRPFVRATSASDVSFDDADEDSTDGVDALPLQLRSGQQRNSTVAADNRVRTRVSIQSAPLPALAPNTTNVAGTWTCPFDGCAHHVYGANRNSGKELIREHYSSHAGERERKIDLVYAEERPYLPVDNLVKRIREMASATGQGGGLGSLGAELLGRNSNGSLESSKKSRY